MPTSLSSPRNYFAVARDEPEIKTLLDNDKYKLLMMDFILAHPEWANLKVRWKMNVRNQNIKLGQVIPEAALREQLDAIRAIPGISQEECSYLRGQLGPTGKRLFQESTLDVLSTLKLCEYNLEADGNGGYDLTFEGTWIDSMLWEILALKTVNTLYLYHKIKQEKFTNAEFEHIITEMRHRLFKDVALIKASPGFTFSDFGTRRAASTDIHRGNCEILFDMVPEAIKGTSNIMFAQKFGKPLIGTNAHEIRMIPTATVHTPEEIIRMVYHIDRLWMKHHEGGGILLTDTYGTEFWQQNAVKYGARDVINGHVGNRIDSMDPHVAIPRYAQWAREHGLDPMNLSCIPSDGLTIQSAIDVYLKNRELVGTIMAGIGTHISNDTLGTSPRKENTGINEFGSFSVVIKPKEVFDPILKKWISCVKLSDNPGKASGEKDRVELFINTFGTAGMKNQELIV